MNKPGITGSGFAPGAASRPVVRGLDNNRVRIQENGLNSSGVSELGEDHGVPVDPLAANQVEVIRGPATLRWGSQAIGGVVNASNNRIPELVPRRSAVEVRGATNSVDNSYDGAMLMDAGAGNFAFHADVFGRNAQDYRIPSYPYLFPPDPAPVVGNRQPNSAARNNGESIGGSYVFNNGFVGVAVSQFDSLYHIPGIDGAASNTRIDMRQTKVTSKGEIRPRENGVDAIRFWFGNTDYRHFELGVENGFDGVQQTFTNREQESRVEVQLTPFDLRFATLTTAVGVQGSYQRLNAPGAEGGGLFDPKSHQQRREFSVQRIQVQRHAENADRWTYRTQRCDRLGCGRVRRSGCCARPFSHLHAEKWRHRLSAGFAMGACRQRHRPICRARPARPGASVEWRSRCDQHL